MSRVTLTFEVLTRIKITAHLLNEDNIWNRLYGILSVQQ